MKILQIHKYCSKKRGGGSVTAFFETVELLKRKGHQVEVFSMKDPENGEEFPAENFAEYFDFNQKVSFRRKIVLVFRSIFNWEAQKKLEKFLEKFHPDIAHIHNIYHYLTPAIFFTLRKKRIPMVLKLSDYKIICPNYKLFNKGRICQKCKEGKYYQCFLNRCLKNSFFVSLVAMIEAYLHRFLASYQKIDLFLAPSFFMQQKCQEFGIPEEKIEILRNAINSKEFLSFGKEEEGLIQEKKEKYFLFFGRLSEEKGIKNLLKTVKKLKDNKNLLGRSLWIVGQGPQEKEIRDLVGRLGLKKEVKMIGFLQGEALKKIVRKADFVVLPSIWLDNSPLVISEAQLLERPVLVSNLGGSPEMIIDGKTGKLFDPFSQEDFIEKMIFMLKLSDKKREEMGQAGRENILRLNNSESYYRNLMTIYQKVIDNYYC